MQMPVEYIGVVDIHSLMPVYCHVDLTQLSAIGDATGFRFSPMAV